MRKYILNIIALCAVLLTACSKDTVNYEHTNNAEVTFASASIKMPTITEANEGKVSVPLYRGNTKEAVSIAVKVQGGEGIFTPDKLQFDFAAGEAVANLDFTFDFGDKFPYGSISTLLNPKDVINWWAIKHLPPPSLKLQIVTLIRSSSYIC